MLCVWFCVGSVAPRTLFPVCLFLVISSGNRRPIGMNYFQEGERRKAVFDSLVKEHKKTKKRIAESQSEDRDAVDRCEEIRTRIMKFFEENHNFIRPRKNSLGVFSVEDFVKFKAREGLSSFMSSDANNWGFGGTGSATGFWNSMHPGYPYEGLNGMIRRKSTANGVFPFYKGMDVQQVPARDGYPDGVKHAGTFESGGGGHEGSGGDRSSGSGERVEKQCTSQENEMLKLYDANGRVIDQIFGSKGSMPDAEQGTELKPSFARFDTPGTYMQDGTYYSGFLGGRMNAPYGHYFQGQQGGSFVGMRTTYSPPTRGDFFNRNFRFVSNMGIDPRGTPPNPDQNEGKNRFDLFCSKTPNLYYKSGHSSKTSEPPHTQASGIFKNERGPGMQFFSPFFGQSDGGNWSPSHSLARSIPPASTFSQISRANVHPRPGNDGGLVFGMSGGRSSIKPQACGNLHSWTSPDSGGKSRRGRKSKTQELLQDLHGAVLSPAAAVEAIGNRSERDNFTSSNSTSRWSGGTREGTSSSGGRCGEVPQTQSSGDVLEEPQDTKVFGDDTLRNEERSEGGSPGSSTSNTTGCLVEPRTVEDIIEITGPHEPICDEARRFIYELCDSFVEHVMHMSCALAYHRNKDTVEICDVKMTLKTEVDLEFPDDLVHSPVRNESEDHIKRLQMVERDNYR